MLKCFLDSLRFLVKFENRAADYEGQWPFFVKLLQNVGRNDPNDTPLERYRRDATFSCRTLPLIHYGLRAVLKLQKRGNSVFLDKKIDACTASDRKAHCFKLKNALHHTVNQTS